tara:strand:- start:592 stop:1455 length:864 start_codon:yes stop_codon:yes gene_type:complete
MAAQQSKPKKKKKPVKEDKGIGAAQNALKKGFGLVDVDRGYTTSSSGSLAKGNFTATQNFASRDDLIKQNDAKLPTIAGMKLRTQGNSGIDVGDFANQAARKAGEIGGNIVDNNPAAAAALKKKGDEFGIKNLDGQTFRNMANQQGDKLNFDINKDVPGTREYKLQGVANSINQSTSKFRKNSYEPKGDVIDELNRYEKETGKSSGSMNMPKGRPTKKGGTKDPVMRAVRTSIRKETGKPHGQKKKTKGVKGNRQPGDRKFSPADTIAKRRQQKKDADAAMRDTRGT